MRPLRRLMGTIEDTDDATKVNSLDLSRGTQKLIAGPVWMISTKRCDCSRATSVLLNRLLTSRCA